MFNDDVSLCTACSNSAYGGNSRCNVCEKGFFFSSNGNSVPKRLACFICDEEDSGICMSCNNKSKFYSTKASVNRK